MRLPAWLRICAVLGLGVAAYSNIARVPLLYDDLELLRNQSIRALSSRALTPPEETTLAGRPVANLSFAINHAVSGLSLPPLHFTNLMLHLLAALVLMALVRRTLLLPRFAGRFQESADGLSLLGTLLWMLHPVQTESVTYLVQRVELLAALFLLVTLYAALRASEAARPFAWSAAAVLACGLGMGSKETMAVAPIIVLLYDRAFLFPSFRQAAQKRWMLYAGLAATWLVLALQVVTHPRQRSAGLHFAWLGPAQYLGIQIGALPRYLSILLVPVGLIFDYGVPGFGVPLVHSFSQWGPPGALLVALLALSLWAWLRRPAAGFLAISFFILLSPSSSIFPVVTEAISEHRLYLPSAAAVLLLVSGGQALLGRRRIGAALAVAAVLALALLTFRRNQDYATARTLWEDTVRKRPQNARAWSQLARSWEKTAEVTGDPTALDKAIELFQHSLALHDAQPDAHLSLARSLERRGRFPEAVPHCRKAIALEPADYEIVGDAANCLVRAGRLEEAGAAYRLALSLKPDWAIGHYNAGAFLAKIGNVRAALDEFHSALALDGTLVRAWHDAGSAAARIGLPGEALKDLETALRLQPDYAEALEDLAWLLATCPDAGVRDGKRALELAERAHSRRETARSLDVLGAAQAETGRFDLAQQSASRAIELLSRSSRVPDELRERLSRYQRREPWREAPSPDR
jgi:tetratricopeptide (TPR) repeat protein